MTENNFKSFDTLSNVCRTPSIIQTNICPICNHLIHYCNFAQQNNHARKVVFPSELPNACSRITLNKDPTVWLGGAYPDNTCNLPWFGWMASIHCVACSPLKFPWLAMAF
jgi:hypothetical protein